MVFVRVRKKRNIKYVYISKGVKIRGKTVYKDICSLGRAEVDNKIFDNILLSLSPYSKQYRLEQHPDWLIEVKHLDKKLPNENGMFEITDEVSTTPEFLHCNRCGISKHIIEKEGILNTSTGKITKKCLRSSDGKHEYIASKSRKFESSAARHVRLYRELHGKRIKDGLEKKGIVAKEKIKKHKETRRTIVHWNEKVDNAKKIVLNPRFSSEQEVNEAQSLLTQLNENLEISHLWFKQSDTKHKILSAYLLSSAIFQRIEANLIRDNKKIHDKLVQGKMRTYTKRLERNDDHIWRRIKTVSKLRVLLWVASHEDKVIDLPKNNQEFPYKCFIGLMNYGLLEGLEFNKKVCVTKEGMRAVKEIIENFA